MRVSLQLLSCSAVIAIATAAAPAWAQEEGVATADAAGDSGVIIVTAQRRNEELQDVPIAVSVFQSDQLNSAGVDDVLELARITPSLVITEGASQGQPFIRGVGGRNITPGNESTTALYIDGVYQTDKTGIMFQGFPDVASVQVLRGPQGTLFGRNATSGAILVSTRRPDDEFGAMIEGTYGTQDRSARAYVTGPLGDNLTFSASGFYRYESANIINLNPANGLGDRTGDEESYGARANLRWESGDFSAQLQGSFAEGYSNAIFALQPAPGSPTTLGEAVSGIDLRSPMRAYYGEIEPELRYDTWNASLRMELDLTAVNIRSITSYSESGSGVQLDLDSSPASVFWFDTDLAGWAFQQELLVSSQPGSPFQWILGGFYIDYRDGYNALDQFVGLPVPTNFQQRTVPQALLDFSALGLGPTSGLAYVDQSSFVSVNSLGLFGEASYEFGQGTKISVGLRYTDETHELDSDNMSVTYVPDGMGGVLAIPTTVTGACAANPACSDLSTGFSELTYRVVVDHQFTDDVLAYASYNRGFKSGVYNVSSVPNVVATEPEIIDAFEVGIKTQLFDRQLTFNVAAYYYKYDNLQVPVVDPATNTQRSINAASATISGLEVELAYRPNDRLSLSAGFSTFFQSEYDDFRNCEIYRPTGAGLALATPADCSGQDLPVTPDYMFSLSGSYTIPFDDGSSIEIAGLVSYIDDFDYAAHGFYPAGIDANMNPYPAGEGRAPIQDGITTFNLSATWTPPGERFYVRLWGEDLLNSNDTYRLVQTTSFGYYTTFTRGITGGVTVGFQFGSLRP